MRFKVIFVEKARESVEFETSARDVIEMERRFKVKATEGTPSYEQTLFMVYKAAKRTSAEFDGVAFDEFVDVVNEVEHVDEDEAGPTEPED